MLPSRSWVVNSLSIINPSATESPARPMKSITLLLITWTLLAGCRPGPDKPFDRSTAESDLLELAGNGSIDSMQARTLARFMAEKGLVDPVVIESGGTYGGLLDAAEKATASNRGEDSGLASKAMHVQLDILADSIAAGGTNHVLFLSLAMENRSGKNIRSLAGEIRLIDPMGETIRAVTYRSYYPLSPKQRRNRILKVTLNGEDAQSIIDYGPQIPFKALWIPKRVLLE